jgi:TRAP-type C4-dicarboxylate transport system substrate-binding protein
MSRLINAAAASAFLAMLAPAAAQAPAIPPGPRIPLTAVTHPIATMPQFTQVDVPLIRQALAQRSGGRIDVTLASWPERNVNGPEVIRLVRAGQVEIGAAPLQTVSGDVPFLDIADIAGLNPTVEQARRVADLVVPEANRELERFGARIIATFPYTAQVFFCREPVASLADLRGKRVRTAGGSTNDLIQAIGALPVGIAFPEVYTALERGTVDCAITGTLSGNNARWYEVSRGIYALSVSWSVGAYFVNVAWWNRLDPAVRDLITQTMREVENRQWQLGGELTEEGIACNVGDAAGCRSGGGAVVTNRPMTAARPQAADQATVRTLLASTVLPAWVRRCGARCGELYNQIVAPISGVRFAAN